MRMLIGSGFVLFALACSSSVRPSPEPAASPASAAPSPTPDSAGPIVIRIPPRVAAFRMDMRRDYEDPSLGTQLRYLGPDSLLADVFVYPGPGFDERCDSACATEYFEREIAQFQADFPEMLRRRYFDSIAVASESPHTPGAGRLWRVGRHLRLAVVRERKPERSDFHLFYLPGYRVKVRLTYDPTVAREQAVDAFMRDLLPRLVGTPASAPPSREPARSRSDSLAAVYESGKTWDAFFETVDRRRELWTHNRTVATIPADLAARARKAGGPWRILVITEPGCSDSANSVPYIAKLVETTPGLELRLVSSTVGRPWMEAHRSADGRTATPTILVLDADHTVRGCWVEQPRKLQAFWLPVVAAGTQAANVGEKLAWYAKDEGRETLREFVEVLEGAHRGEIICPGA